MSTTATPPEVTATIEAPPTAEAERLPTELFRWNSFVHVGDGAEECEHRLDGKCQVEQHFHAWVRTPNPYQIRDINEKAKAAQARRIRALKDDSSDAHVILEADLDELREAAEGGALDTLVEEIIEQDRPGNFSRAVADVRDLDDESWEPDEDGPDDQTPPKRFENIAQDQEEYGRLVRLPEDERGEDFPELQRTVAAFQEAVEAAYDEIVNPRREMLRQRSVDELIDMVRRDRREGDAAEVYLHTYHAWQTFVCTFKPRLNGVPKERVFTDFIAMKQDTPDTVIAALRKTFERLERGVARGTMAGNA